MKTLAIGSDHAGFSHKQFLLNALTEQGYSLKDFGTESEASCDYPDFAHPLARATQAGEHDFGILICGSGNGVCMVANKYPGIRAALVWNAELAALARQHNNANVICIPARYISQPEALECVLTFLKTAFEGGRHERRVSKI